MAVAKNQKFTYGDLLHWDDGTRYELFDGEPVCLASPSPEHQEISGNLIGEFKRLLRGTGCKAYQDLDVRLFQKPGEAAADQTNAVRPDLLVLCDLSRKDDHGIIGAPELVVEILSDSTRRHDLIEKFDGYQRAGVAEYWIVDPKSQTVSVFALEDGRYHAGAVYSVGQSVPFPIGGKETAIAVSTIFES